MRLCTNIENNVGDRLQPCFTPRGHSRYSVAYVSSEEVRITRVIGLLYKVALVGELVKTHEG